jgi:aldehyde:ferredoxin oxidoreductase
MPFKGGYAGKILHVDLTKSRITKMPQDEAVAKQFIGGRGINIKYLYDGVKPGIDPLSPENRLIFGSGPFVGSLVPCAARVNVTTKSALTGILGDTNSGGQWSPELKYAGYDHIIFDGKAKKPVYLWIDDDHVELKDATHLWGADTWETTEMIQNELGDKGIQVACIGSAGENLVRFACVIFTLGRAAGRGGAGAVMGSKNLKAIAVRGTKDVKIADPDAFLKIATKLFKRTEEHPGANLRGIQGTLMHVRMTNETGQLGYRNMQYTTHETIGDTLSAERFLEDWSIKSKACFACPIHCSHYYGIKEGPYEGTFAEGLEYDTVLELGIKTCIDYYPAVLKGNELANRYGMDTDSLGGMIAWAMECFEHGVITEKDTNSLDLRFGNHEALIEIIHKIARREGFGNLLAEGIRPAVSKIGKGSEQWAHHIKGLTLIVELRQGYGFALGHVTSNIGAHHVRGAFMAEHDIRRLLPEDLTKQKFGSVDARHPYKTEGKGKVVQWYEQATTMADCMEMCKFDVSPYAGLGLTTLDDIAKLFTALTGIPMTEDELKEIVERILALERSFNAREGLSRKDDTLPPRMWEKVIDGPHKGFRFDRRAFDQVLDQYYEVHGWSKDGIPTPSTLEKLNLAYVAKELRKLGIFPKGKRQKEPQS